MKILVLSDIHGSAGALSTALGTFGADADLLLLCGDYLNHGPRNPLPDGWNPQKTGEILNAEKARIVAVRGNCDSEVDQMVLHFPCLAPYTTLFFGGNGAGTDSGAPALNGRIFVHHGHLHTRDELRTLLPPGTLVVSGHTHVSVMEENGGLFYFNPGSIALPKCADGRTCGIIETTAAGIARIALCTIDGALLREQRF